MCMCVVSSLFFFFPSCSPPLCDVERMIGLTCGCNRAMMLPSIGGTLGLLLAPQDARIGRLFAYYMTGSHSGPFVIGLSLWSSNIGGQ